MTLRVIHTPGHTPGSLCLYAAEAHLLFSGDTLFRESIGRTDLPGGDTEQILKSIAERLYSLPADTRVLPGHMQETTIAHERAHNPFVRAASDTCSQVSESDASSKPREPIVRRADKLVREGA